MVTASLIGAGRIGEVHARAIARHESSALSTVYDTNVEAAERVARKYGARAVGSLDAIWHDQNIDAVVIASKTDTHCDLIEAAVAAGKAVLCEKPVDLDIARVRTCDERISATPHRLQIGFQRRYDANFIALRDALRQGQIGAIESVHITTRVVNPPPYSYVIASGGLFRDMTIHDIDIARFLLNAEPTKVFATGHALIDPKLVEYNDIDSAKLIIEFPSGVLLSIENSRRCAYGLDHRVEVFGSEGLLVVRNGGSADIEFSDKTGTAKRPLLSASPIHGYQEAFDRQWDAFAHSVSENRPTEVTLKDGWNALAVAIAAKESLQSGRFIDPAPFMK